MILGSWCTPRFAQAIDGSLQAPQEEYPHHAGLQILGRNRYHGIVVECRPAILVHGGAVSRAPPTIAEKRERNAVETARLNGNRDHAHQEAIEAGTA